EIKGLLDFTPELVVYISENALAYRLYLLPFTAVLNTNGIMSFNTSSCPFIFFRLTSNSDGAQSVFP
ncbi:MAG: hypothetical protein IKR18_11510, partial [Bacteroidaceae bacterium]|nr:hypothetical protein [Bacteroidaceae bacterium]